MECSKHGSFTIRKSYINIHPGCPRCNNVVLSIKLEDLKRRLKEKYGDKYTYDFNSFKGSYTDKIMMMCKEHGESFVSVRNLLLGISCHKCNPVSRHSFPKYLPEEILAKIKTIHGDRYKFPNFEYKGSEAKIKVICDKHGEFETTTHTLLKGCGCSACGRETHAIKTKYTFEDAVEASKIRFGNLYKYESLVYEPYKKANGEIINIGHLNYICPNGHHNKQRLRNHLAGYGCRECYESYGVKIIMSFLDKHNLKYQREAVILNTKFRLDFYIKSLNLVIEYNGTQHYNKTTLFESDSEFVEKRQVYDQIKRGLLDSYKVPVIDVDYNNKTIENYIIDKLKEVYKYYKDGYVYRNISEFTDHTGIKYKNSSDLDIYKTNKMAEFPFTAKSVNEFPLIAGTPLELDSTKDK